MNDFTASNGVRIGVDLEGDYRFGGTARSADYIVRRGGANEQALREFFQAEADERHGVWRSASDPDVMVYRIDSDTIKLHDPSTHGNTATFRRDDSDGLGPLSRVARAYFDAHPEPKPWHDAKPGEGWVIDIGLAKYPNLQAVVVSNEGKFLFRDGHSLALDHDYIRSGHRFHPEVSS